MKHALALLAFVSTPALAQVQTDEFFAVGDTGNSVPAQNVAKLAKSLIPPTGFGVLLGDERYDTKKSVDAALGAAGYKTLETERRLIAAPGNHDIDGCTTDWRPCIKEEKGHFAGWLAAHPSTGGRTYYSVRKANVAIIVLNGNKIERDGYRAGSKQHLWFKGEVAKFKAAGVPFIGVAAHHPDRHSRGSWGRFQDWKLCESGINFALFAHEHFAERSLCGGMMRFLSGLGCHSKHYGDVGLAGRQWKYNGAQGCGVYKFQATPTELRWKFVTTTGAVLDVGSMVSGKQPPVPDVEICSDGTPLPPGEEVCPVEEGPVVEPPPPPPVVIPPPPPVTVLSSPIQMVPGQTIENKSFTHSNARGTFFQVGPGDSNVTFRNIRTDGGYDVIAAGDGGTFNNITVDGLKSTNVKRSCFYGRGTGVQQNVTLRRVDCSGDPNFLPGASGSLSDLREGFVFHTFYENMLIENSRFSGMRMTAPAGSYVNGDGGAAEGETKNITIRNSVFVNNTDGGLDLKAKGILLDHVWAADNSRNIRLWASATLINPSCGNANICIWMNGNKTNQQIVNIKGVLTVRTNWPINQFSAVLLGNANTIKPIVNVEACDIQGPPGLVIAKGLHPLSKLGPGCNVVKPFTGPLVIPDVVGSPAVIGERG